MKRYNAKDFANKRAEIFDTAANETVIINNNNYRHLVFELTARKRGENPLKGFQQKEDNNAN